MNSRYCTVAIGLFVLLFVASGSGMAATEQEILNQEQPPMNADLVHGDSAAAETTIITEPAANPFDLVVFEAAAGDLSLCENDENCLRRARQIQSWLCVAKVCQGTDKSQKPMSCFEGVAEEFSQEILEQMNSAMCPLIASPGAETRRALLNHVSSGAEDELVEYHAYSLALRESVISCEDYIKSYVGAYGPQWKYQWYRALSGCRILAHKSTREQEEKDFGTWFEVGENLDNCAGIVNSEFSYACKTPGAASPKLSNEQ